MIVHFHSSAYSVSFHGPSKRSQMAPRTVLAPGYTGWCLACPEAAVASTGGRSRTPPGGSRRARRTAHSTLQQAMVALASRRLYPSSPPQAVQRAWTTHHERALLSRREHGEPRSRRRTVPREGLLVRRVGVKEGGHLARATDHVSGGFSLPNARSRWYRSRTCSSRPLSW